MLLNPYRFALAAEGLLAGLVSYWKMDEASGDALDSHGTNHLTDTNTVGTAAGKVGTARDFVQSNNEKFSCPSNASLVTGDIDFTVSVWVQVRTSSNKSIIGKWNSGGATCEYLLTRPGGTNRFTLLINGAGTTFVATNLGAPALGTWYHIIFWHDAVNNQIGIVGNNGTPNLYAHTAGVNVTTLPFLIGSYDASLSEMDGLVDEVGFWKRVLTPAERTQLYNGGNGAPYPLFILSPIAAFSGTPLTGTFPLSVTFTDTSTGPSTSWAWEKNNGSGWVPFAGTPNAQHPVEVFAAGTWSVRLMATNAAGTDDEVKTGYVSDQSPLLTGLVSYWKLDEASGNAIDSHGTNYLTDNNTVGTAAGKVGNARDFESGNTEYFSIASNASLQTGDIAFTFTAWVQFESFATFVVILSKDNLTTREYNVNYSTSRINAEVYTPGGSAVVVTANALGAPSLGVWYFIVFWHDPATDKVYLQINNGAINEAAIAGGVRVASSAFMIGGLDSGTHYQFDGLIDEVAMWKRILTPAERTELYNAGAGKTYPFT